MKTLLMVKTSVEVLGGLAFVLAPSALSFILLGVPLETPGAYVFRMFGAAIFTIGLIGWVAREDSASTAALLHLGLAISFLFCLGQGSLVPVG